MAYADYDAYKAALARGQWFTICPTNQGNSTAAMSLWRLGLPAETLPTTAAVPPRLGSGGSFNQPAGNWRLAKIRAAGEMTAAVMIIDRLSHQGGLDGTVAVEQTTNLPTAALTRYTSGEGVMIGLEVHTQVGTTVVDATAKYTNTVPTAARVTEAVSIGGNTTRNQPGTFITLPLQASDLGAKSVEGVTLAATTGTAGAFGVVLYMPLTPPVAINQACDNHVDFEYDLFLRTGQCPLVLDGACLSAISVGQAGGEAMVDVFLIPE